MVPPGVCEHHQRLANIRASSWSAVVRLENAEACVQNEEARCHVGVAWGDDLKHSIHPQHVIDLGEGMGERARAGAGGPAGVEIALRYDLRVSGRASRCEEGAEVGQGAALAPRRYRNSVGERQDASFRCS